MRYCFNRKLEACEYESVDPDWDLSHRATCQGSIKRGDLTLVCENCTPVWRVCSSCGNKDTQLPVFYNGFKKMITTLGIYELMHNSEEQLWAKDDTSASAFLQQIGAPVDEIMNNRSFDLHEMREAVERTFWTDDPWGYNQPYDLRTDQDQSRSSTSYSSRGDGTMYNAWSWS